MNPARQHMPSKRALVPAQARSNLLQRKCACGSHAEPPSNESL